MIAFAVDGLGEIALTVEQTDPDQRYAQVAGRFAVIAGENAETARINGQAFVEAKLGAKIGDQIVAQKPLRLLGSRARVEVGVVCQKRALEAGAENRIVGGVHQPAFIDSPEESFRIMTNRIPQRWMEPLEQLASRTIPAVPEIAGQFFEPCETLRQVRIDFQRVGRAWRLHAPFPFARTKAIRIILSCFRRRSAGLAAKPFCHHNDICRRRIKTAAGDKPRGGST